MKTIEHFVDGKLFSGDSKRTGKVFNPATGEQSAEVKLASTKDVNVAVSNAQKMFWEWSNKPPLHRARIMSEFFSTRSLNLNIILALWRGGLLDHSQNIF